jgi:hypothetical protein
MFRSDRSYGAIHGPKTAHINTTAKMKTPTIANGDRVSQEMRSTFI